MTRRARKALISSGGAILLVAIAVAVGVMMVQSGWLLEKIRVRVVAAAAKATEERLRSARSGWTGKH